MFAETNNANVKIRAARMAEMCEAIDNVQDFTTQESRFVLESFVRGLADELSLEQKSGHTIKNFFTTIRKEIKNGEFSDVVKNVVRREFVVSGEVMADIKARAGVRRLSNSTNVAVYTHIDEYLKAVECACQSRDDAMALVGICAATGRRPVELRYSNFKLHDNSETSLMFSGQAKTRENFKDTYEIPTLVDASVVMNALDMFGSGLARVSVKRSNEAFKEFAKQVNWPDTVKCTSKSLRAMYACMSFTLKAHENVQEWYWVNKVLGHEEYDQVTCQSYMRFKVQRPNGNDEVVE